MTISSVPGIGLGAGQFGAPPQVGDPTATLGAISSQEWQDYMQHFVPYENQLIQYAMDPKLAGANMQTAIGQQTQAQTQATGIEERRLAQFDTSMTPQQRQTANLTRGISNATATVQAANEAKDVTVANQMGILGAPATGITGGI